MVLLANVALTDTFDIWRQRTNQIIIELNRLETEDDGNITSAFLKANQVGAAVTTANNNTINLGGAVTASNTNISNINGALVTSNSNITAAFLKANQVGAALTTANTNITNLGGALTTANANITTALALGTAALPNTNGVTFAGDLVITGNVRIFGTLNLLD